MTVPVERVPRTGATGDSPLVFLLLVGAGAVVLVVASLAGLLLAGPSPPAAGEGTWVYYNEACGDCAEYLRVVLLPTLAEAGYTDVAVRDYVNERAHREALHALNGAYDVPTDLRSHLATFLLHDDALLLQGHVPPALLKEALAHHETGQHPFLLVYQDAMEGAVSYQVWSPPREARTYPLATPLAVYFREASEGPLGTGDDRALPAAVLVTGFLDGVNPCAIAVLLFFLSFLYVARRPRGEVVRMGALYIYAVFLVYFLVGVGLLRAITLSGDPHLLARIGAYLVLALGVLTLGGLYWEPLGALTRTPHRLWQRVRPHLMRATLPSAFAAGLLVGLCTFPCSGGVYVAILGLLSVRTSYPMALGYLALYNLMFVLPLAVLLAAVGNRSVARRLAVGHAHHEKGVRTLSALLMIGVGAVLLVFLL